MSVSCDILYNSKRVQKDKVHLLVLCFQRKWTSSWTVLRVFYCFFSGERFKIFFLLLWQIVCRSAKPIEMAVKEKISMFCHVEPEQVSTSVIVSYVCGKAYENIHAFQFSTSDYFITLWLFSWLFLAFMYTSPLKNIKRLYATFHILNSH